MSTAFRPELWTGCSGAQEKLIEESEIPYSIVRATQFA
jgi:hypothetical protein